MANFEKTRIIRSVICLSRHVLPLIQSSLDRKKSILLLGPRQTGKTTLVKEFIKPDISLSLAELSTRLRYERNPIQLEKDLVYQINTASEYPLVFIDEVQKIPIIMDSIQNLIDNKKARFILTGSSARKLKHGSSVNLLPGRVVNVVMDALTYSELPSDKRDLETLLIYGSLPEIINQSDNFVRENDLFDYVTTYLEEEIRQEALVRNVGAFSQFLELAAVESGNLINFTKISQDIGVSDSTVKEYFQILEDCLIAFKVEPISNTSSRRKLLKSPKYLFFDLGVRRIAANEGPKASIKQYANWFEQYVGIELTRLLHINKLTFRLQYWRDFNGVEVDYILNTGDKYIPVEVKWSQAPKEKDIRHVEKFMKEYENCPCSYVVCRTSTPYNISKNIKVIPWQELETIFNENC